MELRKRRRWGRNLLLLLLANECSQVVSLSAFGAVGFNKGTSKSTSFMPLFHRSLKLCSSSFDDEDLVQDMEITEIEEDSYMASPLSQIQSEEYEALYKGVFIRDENWLDEATDRILNLKSFPMGSMQDSDVDSIIGLMAAWAKRKSVDAAIMVEKLLKRVVDELRVQNPEVHVTARMYTIAMDAWARSGSTAGAERAQHIHDGMVEFYKMTRDPLLAPSTISYNVVMNAWTKCCGPSGLVRGEKLLQEMLEWNDDTIKPDVITFSTLLDAYARILVPNATEEAEKILELMDKIKVKKNIYTFSSLQNVYARSGRSDAPEKAMQVLQHMLDQYSKGDVFAKPAGANYNAVMNAYSRTPSRKNAELADSMLSRMELPVEEGGFDVEPDSLSYALAILACARCPDSELGARLSEKNLEKMEERAKMIAEMREQVSSAAPPKVVLDIECFNVVLTAISRSDQEDVLERAVNIVKRMEEYAKMGQENLRPNRRSWIAVLNAIHRSGGEGMATRAEKIVNHMFKLHAEGEPDMLPDSFCFAALLSAYQKMGTREAAQRADDVLRQMEDLHLSGEIISPPDVYHYTIVCSVWARSGAKEAVSRCIQILAHMKERYKAGYTGSKPNIRTYNSVLDCLAKAVQPVLAEELLYHMLSLLRNGDKDAMPDSFSFKMVITAYTRSSFRDAGLRAEAILDRFLELTEEYPDCKLDVRVFNDIIAYYHDKTDMPDAPYRAEYIFNRQISLFKSGQKHLAPSAFALRTVIDCYTVQRHPDAGECAERLVLMVRRLRDTYDANSLEVTTDIMNCVIKAWGASGNEDSGRRASMILSNMEKEFDGGNEILKPDSQTYRLTIGAWSRCGSPDKAEKAYEVLERMKRVFAEGNLMMLPRDAFSFVINACAFTKNDNLEVESSAFKIAVKVFTEMTESDVVEPSSNTYGWFIQACGRLRVPDNIKEEHIERAFVRCCNEGLVNNFVLQRLKKAAPDPLFKRLMMPISDKIKGIENFHDWKRRIRMPLLPREWTRKLNEAANSNHWMEA